MNFKVIDLGQVDFLKAYRLQKHLVNELRLNGGKDTLIFCEHNPVFTLGRQGRLENILISDTELEKQNLGVIKTDRGGDVTYHGPGQIVVYPVLNLKKHKKDIHWYLRSLEQIIIDLLARYKIPSHRNAGFTGVWVGSK